MDKKLITECDLLSMQENLEKVIQYYESEINRLTLENQQLCEDKRLLLEQLKQALGARHGVGFAN